MKLGTLGRLLILLLAYTGLRWGEATALRVCDIDLDRRRIDIRRAFRDAGRLEETVSLHEQNLAARERVLGPDHPRTLNSRNNLANAYRAAGRTDE